MKPKGKPWEISSKTSRVFGINSVNSKLVQLARWCKYNNPDNCRSHGLQQGSLSDAANGGIVSAVVCQLGGHTSLITNMGYQQPTNQQTHNRVICNKYGSPKQIKEDHKAAYQSKLLGSPPTIFSPSAKQFASSPQISPIDYGASNSTNNSTKSAVKKPILHPDYVHNCYWSYSDLDYADDRKPSPVNSSPDSSAAISEAGVGKLGKHTQLAFRPKKKKKGKKEESLRSSSPKNHYQS